LNKKIKEKNRITDITEDVLDSDFTVILNLIYLKKLGVNFNSLFAGNIPTVDHIFAQSKLKKMKVKKHLINDIGNLRYVSMDENMAKSAANLKNTESIMLVIYGYIITRARTPEDKELKKSLMLSGLDISENVLTARLSELRGAGYLERKERKLKGKAIKKLKKKFLIS
jgi:hypothetical protein